MSEIFKKSNPMTVEIIKRDDLTEVHSEIHVSAIDVDDHFGAILLFSKSSEKLTKRENLILSAPDLYKALKSIVDYWDNPQKGSLQEHINHSLKIAQEAIDKAESNE